MQLVNIGFGNMVSADRVIAIVGPESAPIKRIVQDSRERGALIDATCGRNDAHGPDHGQRPRRAFGAAAGDRFKPLRRPRRGGRCGGKRAVTARPIWK